MMNFGALGPQQELIQVLENMTQEIVGARVRMRALLELLEKKGILAPGEFDDLAAQTWERDYDDLAEELWQLPEPDPAEVASFEEALRRFEQERQVDQEQKAPE